MVQVLRVFKSFNGNALILGIIAFVLVAQLFIKILELSILNQPNCLHNESIDVVYTWVNGSDPKFLDNMNKYSKLKNENIDSSKRRFEDKNELRFSLRSLEKYAPWVNHVYLVTNGQIPYWLNLDYEKITVVTHEEIFKDKDNLPTFSSPAIESNLYRIPGLSKKFIYFNDDIFIGQPLYVDDFYSPSKGYMVFLDYSLPGCTLNCPWLYVGDGQCDNSCNIPKCQFDGGDCEKNDQQRVHFVEEIHSQEELDSFDKKASEEFEMLKQKVQRIIDKNSDVKKDDHVNNNNSSNKSNVTLTKDILNSFKEKTDVDFQSKSNNVRVSLGRNKRNDSLSISELVEEHNRRILEENKKYTRKKRYVHKKSDLNEGGSRVLRSTNNLDGFLESLQYTQRLLNKKFGFKPRYVPAHAPILIDKDIMQDLQNTFPTEFVITESNRFRHDNDVQFGFSYYYFLMSDANLISVGEIFDDFDTDNSGTWSDREIRNILTKIYELPLSYEIVDHFEGILLNCSELKKYPEVSVPPYERYIDSRLPTISKELVSECPYLSKFLQEKFGRVSKYKYEIIKSADSIYSTFRMLVSNITNVVIKLDEIRSKTTKFICLNDNLDESKPSENDLVRAILYDFYVSLFPHPSKFELPDSSRNRFLYMDELNEWKQHHLMLKVILFLSITAMVLLTSFNVLKKGLCKIFSGLFC